MFGTKDPFSGSATELLADFAAKGKGVAFFIFKVPANAQKHDFPVPEITWHDGYFDFSDLPSDFVDPKRFNPRHHLYRVADSKYVMLAMVGPVPAIYNWAPEWLAEVQKQIRYERWTRKAFFLPGDEVLAADPEKPVTEDTSDSLIIKPGDTDWVDPD